MVDIELLTKRLVQLKEYLNDLEEVKNKKDFNIQMLKEDKVINRYVERTLHLAIESSLDIANHIIADERFREPKSNRDIFEVLFENKLISKEKATNLQKMAQFRNILVHDYLKVKPEVIFDILNNDLNDLYYLLETIKGNYLGWDNEN